MDADHVTAWSKGGESTKKIAKLKPHNRALNRLISLKLTKKLQIVFYKKGRPRISYIFLCNGLNI